MTRFHLLSALCIAASLVPCADGATINVKKGGSHPTIASGIAAAAPGDTVKIDGGIYQENVEIPPSLAGLTLLAKGKVVVEALPAGGAPGGPGITVLADDVTIAGITVQNAAGIDIAHPGVGILVTANGFAARDVTTLRCRTAGIRVSGDDVRIERWTEAGSSSGLELDGGQAAVVRDCRVRQVNGSGVSITAFADATIEDCRFALLENSAISAADPANAGVVARRNRVDQSLGFAINVGGSTAIAEDNVIADADAGIRASGDGFAVRRNTLHRIYGFTGISVDDSTSGTVEDNDLREIRAVGIDIAGGASGTLVKNNALAGILEVLLPAIRVSGSNIEVDGNRIRDCTGDGIVVTGDSNLFTNDVVEDCLRDGFDLEAGAAANTISACTVRRCLAEGLDNSGTGQFVNDNTFEECRIDVTNDGSILSFTGNTFSTGGQATLPEID